MRELGLIRQAGQDTRAAVKALTKELSKTSALLLQATASSSDAEERILIKTLVFVRDEAKETRAAVRALTREVDVISHLLDVVTPGLDLDEQLRVIRQEAHATKAEFEGVKKALTALKTTALAKVVAKTAAKERAEKTATNDQPQKQQEEERATTTTTIETNGDPQQKEESSALQR